MAVAVGADLEAQGGIQDALSREPMPSDVVVGSPLWWLQRLEGRLIARKRMKQLKLWNDYYNGEHRMVFSSEKWRSVFHDLFKELADNWCAVAVDAMVERLQPTGFRFGIPQTKGELADPDMDAWDMWQRNGLDGDARLLFLETSIHAEGAMIVWPSEEDPGQPEITVEHPSQVIVETDPANRRRRVAALKRWVDDTDGKVKATLYLPDRIWKFQSKAKATPREQMGQAIQIRRTETWEPRDVAAEPWPLPNPFGVVPVVPFYNRERMIEAPQSELTGLIPLQDAINKLVSDLLVGSERESLPGRWATGLEIPTDPVTGQASPEAAVKLIRDTFFVNPKADGDFGSFESANLDNWVKAIEMFVQHFASQSRTPPHYFLASMGNFPSGEALKSAEAGLVAKVLDRMIGHGESLEAVMRLGFAVRGDEERANFVGAEAIWKDAESRTESEHVDALLKLKAINVPDEQLWEDAGYTPGQIERFKQMRARQPQVPVAPIPGAAVPMVPTNAP